jgi:hypothetical protein
MIENLLHAQIVLPREAAEEMSISDADRRMGKITLLGTNASRTVVYLLLQYDLEPGYPGFCPTSVAEILKKEFGNIIYVHGETPYGLPRRLVTVNLKKGLRNPQRFLEALCRRFVAAEIQDFRRWYDYDESEHSFQP